MTSDAWPLPVLPPRSSDGHKGDYGRALIIGGARGMSGAVALSGQACLRSGAGLVRLAVSESSLDSVAAHEASYMTLPLPQDTRGRIAWRAKAKLVRAIEWSTVVACGPGLGQSVDIRRLVAWLYQHVTVPLVVDADGLNALAQARCDLARHAGPRILTPHVGEFRRLTNVDESASREELEAAAVSLAKQAGVVMVLKGHRSLVTDGARVAHNTTGNPGMATGGTGDVLTGVVAALVGQGMPPADATRLGVHIHGAAGDLAAQRYGQVSMIASDLVRCLPDAFRS